MHALTPSECEFLLSGLPGIRPRLDRTVGQSEPEAPLRSTSITTWRLLSQRFGERFGPVLAGLARSPISTIVPEQATSDCVAGGRLCGRLEPLDESLGLELGAELLYPLMHRLLGGAGEPAIRDPLNRQRVLGGMERHLAERVAKLAGDQLCGCLSEVTGVPLAAGPFVWLDDESCQDGGLEGFRSSNRLQILVAGMGYEGLLTWWIPDQIAELLKLGSGEKQTASSDSRGSTPIAVEAERNLVVVVGEVELTEREWFGLEVGDVILADRQVGGGVLIEMDGGESLRGEVGVWSGQYAIQIQDSNDRRKPLVG